MVAIDVSAYSLRHRFRDIGARSLRVRPLRLGFTRPAEPDEFGQPLGGHLGDQTRVLVTAKRVRPAHLRADVDTQFAAWILARCCANRHEGRYGNEDFHHREQATRGKCVPAYWTAPRRSRSIRQKGELS